MKGKESCRGWHRRDHCKADAWSRCQWTESSCGASHADVIGCTVTEPKETEWCSLTRSGMVRQEWPFLLRGMGRDGWSVATLSTPGTSALGSLSWAERSRASIRACLALLKIESERFTEWASLQERDLADGGCGAVGDTAMPLWRCCRSEQAGSRGLGRGGGAAGVDGVNKTSNAFLGE